MNLRSDLALMLSGHAAVPGCLLFRQADGLRLDGCLTLLTQEGQSLALSSPSDPVLDHYADLLVHRLRRLVTCPVEIYFPASTSALVARFEELVARLSVQQAMESVPGTPPERIWLVHEAGALSTGELQLLTRLVGNFPGAGVRVVLLFGASATARKGFESPGRRFARWDIQPPSAEEAAAMLAQARLEGGESVVASLLGQMGLRPALPPRHDRSGEALAPVAEPTGQPRPWPASPLASSPDAEAAAPPRPEPAATGWRRWLPRSPLAGRRRNAPQVLDVVPKRRVEPAGFKRLPMWAGQVWRRLAGAPAWLRRLLSRPSPVPPAAEKLPASSKGTRP